MRIFLFVVLIFSLPNAFANPDFFSQLKLYRTYYFAQRLSSMDHQFVVWVRENNQWRPYVSSKRNVYNLNTRPSPNGYTFDFCPLDQIVAGDVTPPKKLEEPPKEFTRVVDVLNDNIEKVFPSAKEVRTGYLGVASRVRVIEFVPLSYVDPKNLHRVGHLSERVYNVNGNGVQLLSQSGNGVKVVDARLFEDKELLNFSIYYKIEGSLLLQPGMELKYPQSYSKFLDTLKEFVIPTNSRFVYNQEDLLKYILRNQGEEVIPNLLQTVELKIHVSGHKAKGPIVTDRVIIRLPVQEALKNKLQLSAVSELGVRFEITGGIGEGRTLSLTTLTASASYSSYIQTEVNDLVQNQNGYIATLDVVRIKGNHPKLSIPGSAVDRRRKFSFVDVNVGPILPISLETEVNPSVAYLDHGLPAPIDMNLLREVLYGGCATLFE